MSNSALTCCTNSSDACVELTRREWNVCHLICQFDEPMSFSKLKELSDLHQEVLSRILRRLTIYKLIEKALDGKYQRVKCSQ